MESEFLSHKDAVLLRSAPGLVLDGLEILAFALRARRTLLAVGHRIDPGPVREQVAVRRSPVEVRHLDGGFVAGQESALVNRLDGRPGLPGDPLVPVRERGVDGRPTLVVNAETLAQLALLARYGADWFRSVGTPEDPGTFLVSLTGSTRDVVPRSRRGRGSAWHAAAGRADRCRHAVAARPRGAGRRLPRHLAADGRPRRTALPRRPGTVRRHARRRRPPRARPAGMPAAHERGRRVVPRPASRPASAALA